MNLQTNPELELAFQYVRHTNKSIFLTGKAGSGKTTFLHQIKAEGLKRLVVVAPTGVAAINAGGMTIHSFFQLPFGLHLPGIHRQQDQRQHRVTGAKISLIRSLDLLVIDEISMVRADLLDAIDEVLRRYRYPSRPFGGVQLLMIGDLHQLPPVVKQDEWDILRDYYDTPYFFGSQALNKTDYISVELKHIYRQSDAAFIGLLNKVRDNRLDQDSLGKINSRYVANFRPQTKDAFITLTATNAVASDINTRNLAQLPGASRVFKAQISGEFPTSAYPTEETLEFKTGAQVMFIKNCPQPEKRYFNGKIGRITRIDDEAIYVRCPDDPSDIEVTPAEWQNVKYSLNEATKEVEEQVVGMFIQYPLKLAWAITIHKSQGLTFERVIIDAQAAFAHGQVYVALSRCKSFEGIVLRSKINLSSVKTDPVVKNYSEEAERNAPSEQQVQQAKREYQQSLLEELFSFQVARQHLNQLCRTYQEHQNTLTPEASGEVQKLADRANAELFQIAERFQPQLAEYLRQDVVPEANEPLQGRVRGAAAYFTEKLAGIMREVIAISTATDNQAVRKEASSRLRSFHEAIFVKNACFAACASGFTPQAYQRATANAQLDFAAKSVAADSGEIGNVPKNVPHPELYRQLLRYRDQMAEKHGTTPREILTNASLRELVTYLPTNQSHVRLIHGVGKARLKRYGKDVGDLIQKYCVEHKLSANLMSSATPPPPNPLDTKHVSLTLFREGKSIEQIAADRKLARSTIEGHLAHFIGLDQLDIYSVLTREKVTEIQEFFTNEPSATAAEARAYFREKHSYGELKMVLNHIQKDQAEPGN
jgi:hypothetical protein